jgi:hypothetical protein
MLLRGCHTNTNTNTKMKTKRQNTPVILGLVASGILSLGSTHAATIYSIANSSFEAPVTGIYTPGYPTSWNGSDYYSCGVQQASTLGPGMTGATGAQVGYVNSDNSIWTGTVTTLTLGETYTLTVDVGSRSGFASSGFQIGMFTTGDTPLAVSGFINPVDDDAMHAYSVNYTHTSGSGPLYIMLSNASGSSQTSFDNVRLTSVPEPSAALLGGLGMLALLRRRR